MLREVHRGLLLVTTLCVAAVIGATPGAFGSATPPTVVLARKQLRSLKWFVFAGRARDSSGQGPLGARRPCIGIGVIDLIKPLIHERHSEICYGEPGYLSATAEPILVFESIDREHLAVVGGYAPAVVKLGIRLQGGKWRAVATRAVSRKEASVMRLRRFRFSAFVLPAGACVEEVATYNKRGAVLWQGPAEECGAEREISSSLADVDGV